MNTERKQITVTQILEDLKNGLTRKQIKEKYELTGAGMKRLFQHEKLKNKKAHTGVDFDLVDDTTEEQQPAEEIPEPEPQEVEELPENNEIEVAEDSDMPNVPETSNRSIFD